MFESKWGQFIDNGKAYRIMDPLTPRAWENYLYSGDGKFQTIVSQRGQGAAFFDCPEVNRVSDGRIFCLCTPDGRFWSLHGGPANQPATSYQCTHEAGLTSFQTEIGSIKASLDITLAQDSYVEIDRVTLHNVGKDTQTFSLVGCHLVNLRGIDNKLECQTTRLSQTPHALLVQRRHYRTPKHRYAAFFSVDKPISTFCGSRQAFFGCDCELPDATALTQGKLPNVNAHGTEPILALQHGLTLKPGETVVLHYAFGVADTIDEAETLAAGYGTNTAAYAGAFDATRNRFEQLRNRLTIDTPDTVLNMMLENWMRIQLDRQTVSARATPWFNWRNHIQDAWAYNLLDTAWSSKWIAEACRAAKDDGFMPRCSARVPGFVFPDQSHPDIATWAALCAERYAAETGDWAFFDKPIEYAGGAKSATLCQCLINGLDWLLNHRGQNGMVLMLQGDWSDPLEEVGKRGIGESPWTSMALINAINAFVPVLRKLNKSQTADRLAKAAAELTDAVNRGAWDGDWYIRAITDDGVRLCTADDPDGNVSLLMQSWAVISGVASSQRLERIKAAVDRHNKTAVGPILYAPPFMTPRPSIGRETAKPPGTCVNGSCYSHVAMMWAMAEARLGNPDDALDVIQRVLPLRAIDATAVTTAVPLWMPNYFHGPQSATPGQASDVMTSAAVPWLFLVVCEELLGVKATLDGLRVAPRLPNGWDNVTFVRHWKGSQYRFVYTRRGTDDAVRIDIDGTALSGNVIASDTAAQTHTVTITIGTGQ